ncbi:hypothetical protein HAX54_015241 [Datura stramonium]|uniref:Uncharacterized protein n=1 Tax=Datura stramonium TaxID=4076 RepID=A0ABS8TPD6_DATST|nr:hypothetical protein [Datura stramonium]
MKKKFCLCYFPSVVESDDDSPHLSSKIIAKKSEKKSLSFVKKENKSIHKLPSYSRRKIFSYSNFPRLIKAILFQDPLRNIEQLEFELKSKVGWNKDEKCFKKLENREMEVEEVNRIPQQKVNTSVSHEFSSTKANTCSTWTSCDHQKKKECSCSLSYLIVFAFFMTIFLGKFWAILLTLSWLYSIPYQSRILEGAIHNW